MRQPGLLIEIDDGSLSVRPQLRRGGSQGVGGLQRVPALNAPATLPAATDVDVEPAVDRPARDLDLVLLIDAGLLDGATAIGAGNGQGGLVNLVNLLGWRAVCLGAVGGTGLAAGLRRVGLGQSFGEG